MVAQEPLNNLRRARTFAMDGSYGERSSITGPSCHQQYEVEVSWVIAIEDRPGLIEFPRRRRTTHEDRQLPSEIAMTFLGTPG
jgi:hypothetical protein